MRTTINEKRRALRNMNQKRKEITTNKPGFGLVAAVLLVAVSMAQPAQAITTYGVTVSGTCWTGSHTINASDSGMSTKYYAATVFDSNGSYIARGQYGASIDTTSYNLTLTFGATNFPSGFCGTIHLRGTYGSGDTSDTNDFVPSSTGTGLGVYHQNNYSQRTVNGKIYASDIDGTALMAYTSSCAGSIHAYFDGDTGQLTFAHSVGHTCLYPTNALAADGSSYPAGSVHLATCYVYYTWIGYDYPVVTCTDDRSW
jgi:hypothetical protein